MTHYERLGLDERLELEASDLQRRYHALSRAVHPDRFVLAGPQEQHEASERSEALNAAYRVLRDPLARRRYLLSLHGFERPEAAPMPEWADEFFACLAIRSAREAPSEAERARLEAFVARLEARLAWISQEAARLGALHDQASPAARDPWLEAIGRLDGEESFLLAMRRDLCGEGRAR